MNITHIPNFSSLLTLQGARLKASVVSIGPWNMDTTSEVAIQLGVSTEGQNILAIYAMIRNDAEDGTFYPLDLFESAVTGTFAGGLGALEVDVINLIRRTGGFFDSTNFDNVGITRGYVVTLYLE